MSGDNPSERFAATSGRAFGIIGLVVGAGFVVGGLVSTSPSWGLGSVGVLVAVLSWAVLLRPAASVGEGDLVLRGIVDTVRVPLAAIEDVAVRQVLVVRAGGKRYANASVGRGRRELVRESRPGTRTRGLGGLGGSIGGLGGGVGGMDVNEPAGFEGASYGVYVESRVRELASDARKRAGVAAGSPEQAALADGVRRQWAVPEIAGLTVAVVLVVLAAVL